MNSVRNLIHDEHPPAELANFLTLNFSFPEGATNHSWKICLWHLFQNCSSSTVNHRDSDSNSSHSRLNSKRRHQHLPKMCKMKWKRCTLCLLSSNSPPNFYLNLWNEKKRESIANFHTNEIRIRMFRAKSARRSGRKMSSTEINFDPINCHKVKKKQ